MQECPLCNHKVYKRTEIIRLRVTEEELEMIQAGAKRAHLTVSAFLRKLAFEDLDRARDREYKGLLRKTMAKGEL